MNKQQTVLKNVFLSFSSSMDNLEKFANDLLDGKLEPYLKSEPVPTQDEAVKVSISWSS